MQQTKRPNIRARQKKYTWSLHRCSTTTLKNQLHILKRNESLFTIYLNLQKIDELQKKFMKNIMKWFSDRCYQKPGNFNITKTFYLNFNLSTILQWNNFRRAFSRRDKDPRLRLTTLSFNCYNFHFKRYYNSKPFCCCVTTLQRKGLNVFWSFLWKMDVS